MEAAAPATGGVNLQIRRVGYSGDLLAHGRDVDDHSVALTERLLPLVGTQAATPNGLWS